MRFVSRICFLFLMGVFVFSISSVWAGDTGVSTSKKPASPKNLTVEGSSKEITGYGPPAVAEGNRVSPPIVQTTPRVIQNATAAPGGTSSLDLSSMPRNVAMENDMCQSPYYCVVPHGHMFLATCILDPSRVGVGGSVRSSELCQITAVTCQRIEELRRAGETLSAADQAVYDRSCNTP